MTDIAKDVMDQWEGQKAVWKDALPQTTPYIGQIRTLGNHSGRAHKFMFQFGPSIEFHFLASKKFAEILETRAFRRKTLKSWHSNTPYTPVLFWPEGLTHNMTIALFYSKNLELKLRAYKLTTPFLFPMKLNAISNSGINLEKG